MTDQYNRFNEARDFPLQQQIAYQQGILGNAVTNSPQNPIVKTSSTGAGALGGAMAGLGAYNQFAGAFGNPTTAQQQPVGYYPPNNQYVNQNSFGNIRT